MCIKSNAQKLRAWAEVLDLSPTMISELVGGYSRSYVARVMSLRDSFQGSPSFWMKAEAALGKLVEHRQVRVFDVPTSRPEQAEELLRTVPR